MWSALLHRTSINKVSSQKTLYYATSNNLCFCNIPRKTGNTKVVFFTHCISALLEFNQLLLDFFNLFHSRHTFRLLYDSLNLVINAFSLELLWGTVRENGKSRALQQLECVARIKHQCAVFWVSSFAR